MELRKNDICPEGSGNTPFMVIEFYDASNPTVLKNVSNLGVGIIQHLIRVFHFQKLVKFKYHFVQMLPQQL